MARPSYLNKKQRTEARIIAAFSTYFEGMIEEYEKNLENDDYKDFIKFLKYAKTYGFKALDEMFKGIDNDQVEIVVSEGKKMEISARYRNEAVREFKEMQKLDSNTVLTNEEFTVLVEHSIFGACQARCNSDHSVCELKKVFIRHDVEALNLYGKEKCPYKYPVFNKCFHAPDYKCAHLEEVEKSE